MALGWRSALYTSSIVLTMLATWGACAQTSQAPTASRYAIGIYYYPGWKIDNSRTPPKDPWAPIRNLPEREPLLGWYQEGDVDVMEQQLQWMYDYGIKFIVFDWYWTNKRARNEHALAAYFKAKNKHLVPFTILWANHEASPKTEDDFTSMVRYWARFYFKHPQYIKVDDRPVVHIFGPLPLEEKAKAFGSSTSQLFAKANAIAKEHGFPGIHFVAGIHSAPFVQGQAQAYGYQSLNAYNYSGGRTPGVFHSYAALDKGYQEHWDWILKNSLLPYMIPMSSGWDRRPWGGSKDPRRDLSVSTPDSFEAHLRAARDYMDKFPDKTQRMGVICCWNEFGEGSFVEPTKTFQMQYLERVKKVFGGPN